MTLNDINYGSTWNKWDLHIHSPYTNMNGYACSDEKFIQKIQDEKLVCAGLTNYFKFKDEEYILKEKLEKLGIKVLMNLEIRLDYVNKDDESLDLHIVFSETVIQAEIEKLLHNLECNVKGETKKIIDLSNEEDFKFAVVNFDRLFECLENESLNLQAKYLIGFLSRGKGNARSSSNFEKIANKAHFLIHSTNSQNNIDKDKGFWQQHNKPILQSSDAHSLETIGSKFSWVKAKPSFDGLKQVIYENERVCIGKESPTSPLYKLEKVQLNFDENVLWDNEKKDKFCFADFNQPLYFSPYFTCIIGGRGSGKSTLLNLIANKIDKLDNENKKKLPKDSKEKVIVEPNILNNIEFLAQNEIEEFATNSIKFTQAIFERLDRPDKKLTAIQNEITAELNEFDKQIARLLEYNNKTKILENKQKESDNIVYLLKTFMDGDFNKNYMEMNISIKDKNTRLKWKTYYENALQNLSQLIQATELKLQERDESPETWTNDNNYKKRQKAFNDELKNILQKYQSINFEVEKDKITSIEKEISNYREKIDLYLQGRGYNLENLNDLKNQISRQSVLNDEIDKLKKEIEILKQDIDSFDMSNIDNKICEFTTQINNEISNINKKFLEIKEKYPENIKEIKVEFTTNSEVFDNTFEEFISKLSLQDKTSSTLKDYLSKISLYETLSYNNVELFQQRHKDMHNNNTMAYKNLAEIFSTELNFKIYKLLIEKHLRDIEKYKIFKVLYDDKELQFSSFGQRCTAVIVILLALGNNPIIMDEPEAHLDSSLIANYVVELIKEQKKDRQIIFATHNANFVLNADAELIIKLNNEGNKITAQSFSIEDSQYREDLLKLEGGKEAFKKRERKYEI